MGNFRIDGPGNYMPNDDGEENGASVVALPGGGFAVQWIAETTGDRDGDTYAIQRYDAAGAKLGSVVLLQDLPEVLRNDADNGSRAEAIDLASLADGGYALTYAMHLAGGGRFVALDGGPSPASILIAGRPVDLDFDGDIPDGVTFTLHGTANGNPHSVQLIVEDGEVDISRELLSQFTIGDRFTLQVSGLAEGESLGMWVGTAQTAVHAEDSALQSVARSVTVANGGAALSAYGRVEAFDIEAATPASASATYTMIIVTATDPHWMDLSSIPNASVTPTGSITITGLQPDANGVIAVPQAILDQLDGADANVILNINGLVDGSTLGATLSVREGLAQQEGVFAQTFDENGLPTGGIPARIDGPGNYMPYDEEDEENGANIVALSDGGYAVQWLADTSGDDDGDTIAIQRYDATGAEVGAVVLLQDFPERLVDEEENGSSAEAIDLTSLADGGFALTYAMHLSEGGRFVHLNGGPNPASILIAGRPVEIDFTDPIPEGVTFTLRGTGPNGPLAVQLSVVNGEIDISRELLSQFTIADRFTLQVSGLSQGETLGVSVGTVQTVLHDEDGALQSVARSVTVANGGAFLGAYGRVEAFDIETVTPTGATANYTMTIATATDPHWMDLSGVPNAFVSPTGIVIPGLQPDENGIIAVPQTILDQLDGADANVILSVGGLVTGSTLNATLSVREGVAQQEGIFVHTFDENGVSTGGIPARIDGPGNYAPNDDEDEQGASVVGLSGGGFAVQWIADTSGDDDGDTLAIQRYDAAGAKLGSVVLLQDVPESLIDGEENGSSAEAIDLTSLEDGGFALTYAMHLSEGGRFVELVAGPNPASILIAGRPSGIFIDGPVPDGVTFTLRGTAGDTPHSVQLIVEDGEISISPELLSQFTIQDRFTLEVSILPEGETLGMWIGTSQTVLHDEDSALQSVAQSVTAANGVAVLSAYGRVEAFDIVAVTPTGASANYIMIIAAATDPHSIDLSGVPSAFVSATGSIIIDGLQPDANGIIAVPQTILDQLEGADANVLLRVGGLVNGSTLGATLSVREGIAQPEGIFVRTFDENGIAAPLPTQFGESVQGTPGADNIDLANYPGAINVRGAAGDDSIIGSDADNYLTGDGGNDTIDGGGGERDIVAFNLAAGTTGSYRTIDGTGEQSGQLIVQRVDGDAVEDVFLVTLTETGAIVEGIGSAAHLGTDIVTDVDDLHFLPEGPFDPSKFASILLSVTRFHDDFVDGFYLAGSVRDDEISLVEEPTLVSGNGGRGDDTITSADTGQGLRGDEGNDILLGGGGDDFFVGDARSGPNAFGNDVINGGAGIDRASFNNMVGGVTVSLLLQGQQQDTGVTGLDTLIGIEHLTGSTFDDILTGDAQDNWLWGLGGSDQLSGNGGNDLFTVGVGNHVLTGGDGADSVSFFDFQVAGSVSIDLALQRAQQNTGQGLWTLNGIENLSGGGLGDTLNGDAAANVLAGADEADTLTGGAGNDRLLGDGYIDTAPDQYGHSSAIAIFERSELVTDGDDRLDGGIGADRMVGGGGDDIYTVDNSLDVVVELADEGTDRLVTSLASFSLASVANVEELQGSSATGQVLTGTAGINYIGGGSGGDTINGGGGVDELEGAAGNDRLDGGTGADDMEGGIGDDTYVVDQSGDQVEELASQGSDLIQSAIDYTLGANVEKLTLTGSALAGTGNTLDNEIIGNAGANTFNGGLGADKMTGGDGNDSYTIDNVGDRAVETSATGGTADRVLSSVSYALAAGTQVEQLATANAAATAALNLTGNEFANAITGNAGTNRLNGGLGADTLTGGNGNDIYVVDNTGDKAVETSTSGGTADSVESSVSFTLGLNVEQLTLTGAGAINGTGNTLANIINGNAAANILNGGAGADTMTGGLGNDSYVVDNALDKAIETSTSGGTVDSVSSSVSYALGLNVERLTLTGAGAINGTGNTLANIINGNGAANILNGGAGADTLTGGLGNDTYVVDNAGDRAVETSTSGGSADTVSSTVSFALGLNVERLTLTGAGAVNGTGNGLANVITGNAAANILNGGAGADTMTGGLGNDTYVVDNALDKAVETSTSGGSADTVSSTVSFALGLNVERLTLSGVSAVSGTGNTLANIITGNAAANTLNGGAGSDTLSGGLGNDTYVVDNSGDRAVETSTSGGSADTVNSSVSFALGLNVERLTLTGAAASSGTGNGLANIITGNGAANILNGGAGADTLTGGLGNDTYVVDNAGDRVVETSTSGGSTDRVLSSVTYTLGLNVEQLTLTGTASTSGTGNALVNRIAGNGGANTLNGAGGKDFLTGGAGVDRFLFDSALNASTNWDDILDFSVKDDTIVLDRSIFTRIAANGTLSSTAFVTGTAAADAADRIVYDRATGNIFYDADGTGTAAKILFAQVNAGTVLTNADFIAIA